MPVFLIFKSLECSIDQFLWTQTLALFLVNLYAQLVHQTALVQFAIQSTIVLQSIHTL
jgi:hypothetical protein